MGLFESAVRQVKAYLIDKALKECGGNQSAAAAKLGLHRNTLLRNMQDLGVFNSEKKKIYRVRA